MPRDVFRGSRKFSREHLLRPRAQLETPTHTAREQIPQGNSPVELTTVSTLLLLLIARTKFSDFSDQRLYR